MSKPVGLSYLIGEAKNLEIVKVEGRIVKQLEKNRFLLTDRSGHAVEVVLDPKFGFRRSERSASFSPGCIRAITAWCFTPGRPG